MLQLKAELLDMETENQSNKEMVRSKVICMHIRTVCFEIMSSSTYK